MDELKNIKVSTQEKNEIKKDSPGTLPLNPTAQGFSGAEIRRRLSKSITGEEGSVLSLFVDKMDIISDLFHIILDENNDESLIEKIKQIDGDIENILLELVNKVDKITQEQIDSFGSMENDDRIVSGVDGSLNEMPIKASINKEKNTIVMRDSGGTFQDLYDHNTVPGAHSNEFNKKVDKTQTIIGLDLQDNILIGEFRTALGNATQSAAGLLSAEDKTHLDVLVALLENSDGNNVVDTIGEILAIFNNYPEGAELVTVLQGKVDKVAGKGLSTNDFTDALKNKLNTLETSKQDKLTAGDNITIDENTNMISASGVDLNEMAYFDYAGSIYRHKYSLLPNAWEHSLTVDPLEISENSSDLSPRGKAQYPNGETEGVIIPQNINVTGIGESAFSGWTSNNQPLVIPNSVTSIGAGAFHNWSSNNHPLVIPNSVTSIGQESFWGWVLNNQPLTIPNSVKYINSGAFMSWSSNNHPLVIPNSVESIGDYAFNGWSLVPYVEIQATTPPTLTNINAFGNQNNAPIYVPDDSVEAYKEATNWVSLADRIFPISDKLVGGGEEIDLNATAYSNYAGSIYGAKYNLLVNAWESSLTVDPLEISEDSTQYNQRGTQQYPNGETEGVIIPQGVTNIGRYAFRDWTSNNQPLVIPNSVTIIGNGSFANWTSNNQPLVIPNSVTSIDGQAFSGWSSNNQPLVIPNSVTNITDSAFMSWSSNNQPLVIPNSVTSIGAGAFQSWSSNNQPLVIPNSVTSIDGQAFTDWSANNQPLTIPNSVTNITDSAFQSWSSNNHPLVIPNSVTNIGDGAFADWHSNNQPLTIPNSVTNIGNGSFYAWSSNNHPLVIANSVTNIGDAAFYNWSLVPYVEMKATTPPSLAGASAFSNPNNAPIYVPDESVAAYKSATNWVDLADRIFSINDK